MSRPKNVTLKLNEAEREELENLVKRHSVSQQIALRARIILAADVGKTNKEIAKQLGVSLEPVQLWQKRWLTLQGIPANELSGEERLEDLPRAGAPAQITTDQLCQIVAMACEKPEESGRPISHWTGREIADEIIKRNILADISPRHAARLLKRSRSQTTLDSLLADCRSRRTVRPQDSRCEWPLPRSTGAHETRRTSRID
jgi:putative transposase